MSLSLKIKTERAFAAYIESVLTVGSLNIYEGHTPVDNDEMQFPALVIYAESADFNDELPSEMGVKNVLLRARFYIDSEVGSRDALDTWKDDLEREMRYIEDIKTALNKPAAGPDNRTYKAIHFHDVTPSDEPSDREGQDWTEEMSWEIIVEPLSA